MAQLPFDFSRCAYPALALRIANLITHDIEKLEHEVLATSTAWQKMDKPFKAHYAIDLVNRIKQRGLNAHALECLPNYEYNVREYKANKSKGRPLTEYVNVSVADNEGNNMSRIEIKSTAEDMDSALSAILEAAEPTNDDGALQAIQRMQQAVADKRKEQADKAPAKPAGPQADDGAGKDQDSDPLRAAVQSMLDAMKVKQGEDTAGMDDDRVREIAREEDAVVLEAVGDAIRAAVKQAALAGTRVVEVKRQTDAGEEREDMGVQHARFPTLLKLAQLRNMDGYPYPVWLPGPAGSGKTTAARNVAKALKVPFQFTGAVDNPYQLLGFRDAGGTYHRTSFREAFEHGGVFLWDEVDASNPNALTVFNAALENGVCAFPDGVVTRHKDCIIIAAANTYGHGATHEYVGRNKLDAATVDRFIMLDWGYDEALERALSLDDSWTTYVQKARKACAAAGIKHVISPRASIRGGELLADGFDRDFVIDAVVRKGLPDDSWKTITSRMGDARVGTPTEYNRNAQIPYARS